MSDLGEAIARGESLRLSIDAGHRKRCPQSWSPFMAEAAEELSE